MIKNNKRNKNKSRLKIIKKTIFEIDFGDLEDFIKEVYKKIPNIDNYNFVASQEGNNDSVYDFEVNGEIDEYNMVKILKGDFSYCNAEFLNMLCRDGYIKSGTFLVNVCW